MYSNSDHASSPAEYSTRMVAADAPAVDAYHISAMPAGTYTAIGKNGPATAIRSSSAFANIRDWPVCGRDQSLTTTATGPTLICAASSIVKRRNVVNHIDPAVRVRVPGTESGENSGETCIARIIAPVLFDRELADVA